MGIPVKVNIDSGGKPNGVPERRLGLSGDLACRGKGRQPLCPCFLAVEEGIHGGRSQHKR